jgi:DNA-binding response OmpR family regulator
VLHGPLDGVQTAERIRALSEVPIIFMTAHSDPATRHRAMQADPDGYLVKPFSDGELRDAVGAALRRSDSRAWEPVPALLRRLFALARPAHA